MTTRKESLIALRDKVRDGEWKQTDAFGASTNDARERFVSAFNLHDAHNAWAAYHGSIDAAVALCEAVLPGWEWDVSSYGGTDDRASAKLQVKGDPIDKEWQWGVDEIPARALLLAILEALIAEEE